jgi:superfamily II DNA/RNA helicase
MQNAIIFCNRKRDVATLWRSLEQHGYSCGALHGDMDQRSRTTMLNSFREGKIDLLVASDVAARGLDIPNVSHVFNFDVPVNAEDYVHRIGRTGRAGREGMTYMLVTPGDKKGFEAIEKLIEQSIEWQDEPTAFKGRSGKRMKSKPDAESSSRSAPKNKRPKPENTETASTSERRKKVSTAKLIDVDDEAENIAVKKQNSKKTASSARQPMVAFADEDHVPAFLLRGPR